MLFETHLGKYTLYERGKKPEAKKRQNKVQKDRNISDRINFMEIKMHGYCVGRRFLEIQM